MHGSEEAGPRVSRAARQSPAQARPHGHRVQDLSTRQATRNGLAQGHLARIGSLTPGSLILSSPTNPFTRHLARDSCSMVVDAEMMSCTYQQASSESAFRMTNSDGGGKNEALMADMSLGLSPCSPERCLSQRSGFRSDKEEGVRPWFLLSRCSVPLPFLWRPQLAPGV